MMSFGSGPAVTKATVLCRSGPRILSALYYVLELARLLCCGITSFFASLIHSLRPPPTVHRPQSPSSESYRLWKSVATPLRLTVVLDLDETLVLTLPRRRLPSSLQESDVHSNRLNLHCWYRGRREQLVVFLRPGLMEFLNTLASFSDLVIYSAAEAWYGDALSNVLDPSRCLFSQRLFRESTVRTDNYDYVKDLGKLGRDLRRTVMVDNCALSFLLQPSNGIRCKPFRGNVMDRELMSVILPLVESLSWLTDVRPTLQTAFRMESWFKSKGLNVECDG